MGYSPEQSQLLQGLRVCAQGWVSWQPPAHQARGEGPSLGPLPSEARIQAIAGVGRSVGPRSSVAGVPALHSSYPDPEVVPGAAETLWWGDAWVRCQVSGTGVGAEPRPCSCLSSVTKRGPRDAHLWGKLLYKPALGALACLLLDSVMKPCPSSVSPVPALPAGCVESGENVTNTTYVFSRKNLKR